MSEFADEKLADYVKKHVYGVEAQTRTYTRLQLLGLEIMAFGSVKHHQLCVSDPLNTRFTRTYIYEIEREVQKQQCAPRLEMRPREGSVTVFEIKGGRVRRQHCIVQNGYVVSSCKVHDVTSSSCDREYCDSCPESLRAIHSEPIIPLSSSSVTSPLQMPSASPYDNMMHDVCDMLLDNNSRDSFHTENGGGGTTTALHGSFFVV